MSFEHSQALSSDIHDKAEKFNPKPSVILFVRLLEFSNSRTGCLGLFQKSFGVSESCLDKLSLDDTALPLAHPGLPFRSEPMSSSPIRKNSTITLKPKPIQELHFWEVEKNFQKRY